MKYRYEIIKIEDAPSLGEEYVGINNSSNVQHTEEHLFDLDNQEQKDKLIDVIKKYGLTVDEFSEEDKKQHPFFYKYLNNNINHFKAGNNYYYYNKYLIIFDKDNKAEKYANGIVLFNNDELNTINNVFRLQAKENKEDKTKGVFKENVEEFKEFFLSKRNGHDFKKDFDEIINAEDNAVEYPTKEKGHFFANNEKKVVFENIPHTAKSPRMEFVLNKTHLNEESKNKFRKYPDLKNFLENYSKEDFNYMELKEFFKAVDNIKNNYRLSTDLINLIKEKRA